MNNDDFLYLQRITITLELPGGPGTDTIAAAAFLDVLRHLEHDGIQPAWATLEITGPPTT
jgi:predicted amino acid dehydrogenase